jgi:hypothetical protein
MRRVPHTWEKPSLRTSAVAYILRPILTIGGLAAVQSGRASMPCAAFC